MEERLQTLGFGARLTGEGKCRFSMIFPMIQFGAYAEVRLPCQVAASLAALCLRQLCHERDELRATSSSLTVELQQASMGR